MPTRDAAVPAATVNDDVPVLVIGGYGDPGLATTVTVAKLRRRLPDRTYIKVSPGLSSTMDNAAAAVVERFEQERPSTRPGETAEVDVVAISMGGLVARLAAMPADERSRLNIRRLYTICSPHSGALLADRAGFFGSGREMRSNSPFLQELTRVELAAASDFPIVAYARENDSAIGDPGLQLPPHLHDRGHVVWLPMPFWRSGHPGAYGDKRIIGDIARRLSEPAP